jgi:prepilin-type N-terminal cleavage/methylation domain-containing protein
MNINLRQKAPGGSPGTYLHEAPGGSPGTPRRPSSRSQCSTAPRAFTLVELLVVIGIIGLLAALLTPVVMQSLTKARNAAIKSEIDMLHMAIMNYKNEYGSFPPCVLGTAVPNRAAKHIAKLFPRLPSANVADQLNLASVGASGVLADATCLNNFSLSPKTAIVFWLEGYTDNPVSPLVPAAQRKKLFDFDQSRKAQSAGKFTGIYSASGKPEAEFWYMDCAALTADLAAVNFQLEIDPTAPVANTPFNKDSFQIVNPGRDGIWNTDDDLSNFWPGTRREYLDSLGN